MLKTVPQNIFGFPAWLLGVMFGVAACCGIAFGMTLLKYTHMKVERLMLLHEHYNNPDKEPYYPKPAPYYCHCTWISGFSLILLASGPLDMGALALLPQSVFAPLSGLTLCLNAVISPWLLGESLTNADAAATALVVVGAGLTTLFGDHKNETMTVQTMMKIFSKPEVMVFECVVWVLISVLIVTVRSFWFEKAYKSDPAKRFGRFCPSCYGVIAGCAGAQQFLFLKASIEIIRTAVLKNSGAEFLQWQTYLFFITAVLCAFIQIRFLNEGLQICDVVVFLPIYNTLLILMGILNGGIIFNEFDKSNMGKESRYVYFFLGCALALLGILTLVVGAPDPNSDGDYSDEYSEEGSSLLDSDRSDKEDRACMQATLPDISSLPKQPSRPGSRPGSRATPRTHRVIEYEKTPQMTGSSKPGPPGPEDEEMGHETSVSHSSAKKDSQEVFRKTQGPPRSIVATN